MVESVQQSSFLQGLEAKNNPHQDRLEAAKSGAKAPGDSKRDQLMADRDAYLQLLIAQLKNQNPQSPEDPTKMTEQIVSISQAEQTMQMNDHMEHMMQMQEQAQRLNAVNMIGKEAEYDDAEQELLIGQNSEFTYKLANEADTLKVSVIDNKGNAIKTLETKAGHKKSGEHSLIWDGRDDNGELMPEGRYRLEVKAFDENNAPVTVSTTNKSKIMGIIENVGNIQLLLANGKTLDQSEARMFTGDLKQMVDLDNDQLSLADKEMELN